MPKGLSEYIEISSTQPPLTQSILVKGRWLSLLVPFPKWREPLRGRWARMARVLFSSDKDESTLPKMGKINATADFAREAICLCAHVSKCPLKPHADPNPLCPKFAFGICVEATLGANDGKPLSFATIGYLTGLSKQRVEQIYSVAQQRLIEAIKKDPVLLEYCEHQGIGRGEHLDNEATQ